MEWPNLLNQFGFTSKKRCNVFTSKTSKFDVKYVTNRDWYVNCTTIASVIPSERSDLALASWWTTIHLFFAWSCCCIHDLWFWSRSSRLSDAWFSLREAVGAIFYPCCYVGWLVFVFCIAFLRCIRTCISCSGILHDTLRCGGVPLEFCITREISFLAFLLYR